MTLMNTPPMGWNSWNSFGAEISESLIKEVADALVSSGLADAGYEYLVLDDFWEADERSQGRLTWDARRFPGGIPALFDTIHQKGLKAGIYSCAGSHTCGGKPGSYGHEEIDARTFAEWGVDYLKYDFCHVPPGVDGVALYRRMGQALRLTGRPIVFSICDWGLNQPWKWAGRAGGHLWRTSGDINDSWESIVRNGFERLDGLEPFAGPGHWNDPDMLVVGMYGQGNPQVAHGGCTEAEYRSHFSLWCLAAAPLMIGCDVRNMDAGTRRILLNRGAIAINQDGLGRPGYCLGKTIHDGEQAQVWVRPLQDGSLAAGLFNLGERNRRLISLAWESLGLHPERKCQVWNVWQDRLEGVFQEGYAVMVDRHDVALLRITPE